MNDSLAISVNNVSKKYRLFGSVKERFLEALHPFDKKYHHEFWALKDVSFDVPKGSTVGIIGRNGSGKSTLLQVISSILQPTSGRVDVRGKISALLELGSGFNMEQTGRENATFHGELMGFTRKEMKERMPMIEEFADIGEFIDQPVKIYSSGMFVRLAFAAAINVEPDILVIDEALAVGDAKFQNKCYRKFRDFQNSGKTIILVTHDMNAIVNHCNHAVLLEQGSVMGQGEPNDVTNQYAEINMMGESLARSKSGDDATAVEPPKMPTESILPDRTDLDIFLEEDPSEDKCQLRNTYNKNEHRFGDRRAEIIDYLVVCGDKFDPIMVKTGDIADIYIKVKFNKPVRDIMVGFSIKTIDGVVVYGNNTFLEKIKVSPAKKSDLIIYKFSIELKMFWGEYFIALAIGEMIKGDYSPIDYRYELIHISVEQDMTDFRGLVKMETTFKEIPLKNILT